MVVPVNLCRELVDEVGALRSRAHDRHVAPKNAPQLRKLIERGSAQSLTHRPDSLIVRDITLRSRLVGGSRSHGSELETRKDLAVPSNPVLPKQNPGASFEP